MLTNGNLLRETYRSAFPGLNNSIFRKEMTNLFTTTLPLSTKRSNQNRPFPINQAFTKRSTMAAIHKQPWMLFVKPSTTIAKLIWNPTSRLSCMSINFYTETMPLWIASIANFKVSFVCPQNAALFQDHQLCHIPRRNLSL